MKFCSFKLINVIGTFGGNGMKNEVMYSSIMNKNGKTNVIRVDIPANSALIIRKD
jgi:hypothetical protein